MKGIIYTELIDFVQDKFGIVVSQKMVTQADTQAEGVFTSVGQYADEDLYAMVGQLSQITGIAVPDLLKAYGHHLFAVLNQWHPEFLEGVDNALDALALVNDSIHVSVKRLYPQSQLPQFDVTQSEDALVMQYCSTRGLADLAEGLILGCIDFYGDPMILDRTPISEDGVSVAHFTISKDNSDG